MLKNPYISLDEIRVFGTTGAIANTAGHGSLSIRVRARPML